MNFWDLAILLAIGAAVIAGLRALKKDRRACGCGGSCAKCTGCGQERKKPQ